MSPTVRQLPSHFMAQFAAGLTYPWRAAAFIQRHHLWRLAALPVCINGLFLIALALIGWYQLWPLVQNLQEHLQAAAAVASDIFRAVIVIVTWLIWLVLLPVTFMVSAVLVFAFGQVFASPFLDLLSERTEAIVMQRAPTPFGVKRLFDSIFWGLSDAFWGLLYLLVIYIPMLMLTFVPGLGGLLSLAIGALLVSQEFVGLPLARRMVSYRARWRLMLRNKWLCFGFGGVTALLMGVPGLNLFVLPIACVGGTLLYCDLERSGRLLPDASNHSP